MSSLQLSLNNRRSLKIMNRLGAIHDDSAVCQKIGREEGVMSSVLLYPSNFVLGRV